MVLRHRQIPQMRKDGFVPWEVCQKVENKKHQKQSKNPIDRVEILWPDGSIKISNGQMTRIAKRRTIFLQNMHTVIPWRGSQEWFLLLANDTCTYRFLLK